MITKMAISFLLHVEKIWNSAQINLSSTLNFLLKILFRRNNIRREIHHWNWRWFGTKWHVTSAWNGRPWPGRSQNWMLMYFIINLSGSQQFSGSSIQNQVELSEWATGRFMHCVTVPNSVAPVKHIVCKWIYMSQGQCCQMTHKWHVY